MQQVQRQSLLDQARLDPGDRVVFFIADATRQQRVQERQESLFDTAAAVVVAPHGANDERVQHFAVRGPLQTLKMAAQRGGQPRIDGGSGYGQVVGGHVEKL